RVPSAVPVRHGRLQAGDSAAAPVRRPPRHRVSPVAGREGAHLRSGGRVAPMSVQVSERTEPPARPERTGEPLVHIRGLKKHFPVTRGIIFQKKIGNVHAVDGIDLDIYPGETVGLVGETGCGKSTTARLILRLMDITEGEIVFEGQDISRLTPRKLRPFRRE